MLGAISKPDATRFTVVDQNFCNLRLIADSSAKLHDSLAQSIRNGTGTSNRVVDAAEMAISKAYSGIDEWC